MLKRMWNKMSNWGNELHDSEEAKRENTITNHGCIYGLFLYFGNLIASIYAAVVLLNLNYEKYISDITIFLSIISALIIVSYFALTLKNKTGKNTFYTTIYFLLSVVFNGSESIMLGADFGFQWFVLALTPLAYIVTGYKRKLFIKIALVSILSFFFLLIWHQFYLPLILIPNLFVGWTYNIMKFSSLFILFSGLSYIGWREGLWSFLYQKWCSWQNLGKEHYNDLQTQETNRISNSIFLVFIGFSFIVFIINTNLAIRAIIIDKTLLYSHLIVYSGGSLFTVSVSVVIFNLKIKSAFATKYEVSAYIFGLIFVSFTAVCLGYNSNYQFATIPFLLVPLFFTKDSWKFRISLIALVPLFVFVTILIQNSVGRLYPLPDALNKELKSAILVFAIASFILELGFVYWKYKYKEKILKSWRSLSEYGNSKLNSETEKRFNTMTNQIILYFGIQFFALLLISIPLLFSIPINKEYTSYHNFLYSFTSIIFLGVILFVLVFYYRHNFNNPNTGKFILYVYGLSFIAIVSTMLGHTVGVHTLVITCIPLPLLAISKEDYKSIIGAEFILILFIIFVYSSMYFVEPPFPLPSSLANPIRYFMNLNTFVTVSAMSYYFWKETKRTEEKLQIEQKKTENLLLNILPSSVAKKLILEKHFDPVNYKGASVMFTDFVGFTKVAESMSAKELTEELDRCFSYFDSVIERYNLEKLKTIGDSYMAAGGIPNSNFTHAFDAVLASLEIQQFMNQMKIIKEAQNLPYWHLRLGINSGPLVAGVVGKNKFAYDIWGETVNLASNMESFGTSGKINISQNTYDQVKYLFQCKYRGTLKKGKRQSVRMYFIEGLKARFSVDGNKRVPNEKFKDIYQKLKNGSKLIAKTL